MAQNINQNGNFHTPLSPMRFQSSMGKQVTRRYKDGKNMVRLSLARVTKVNYKYNTVEVVTIKHKNSTTKNPNDNGRYSARLPVQFGGQTPDGKVFGTNTLVTQGALVLIGFLEGSKDNPIVINIYGAADNQSMLTRTTYNGADESDEELQKELWQLFTLYPSMTYHNIDGHGNQEITFPGKTFFYTSADDQKVNDAFFDYDHLPSSYYANGDLIEPTVPDAPNMLLVHQGVYDKHRVTFFIKSDGTVRMGSRHADGQGVTFYQLGTDGSFRIQQTNDSVNPEDESSNFSSMSIEEDGSVVLQAGEHKLAIGPNGITLDGGTLSGGNIDLTGNETIKDMQGDIITLQKATTATGIVSVVTESSGWQDLNSSLGKKTQTYITQPIPPYNVGDVWEDNGTIYICTNPEPIGATFIQTDWKLAGDVTSNNTAADTANVGGTPTETVLASISSAAATAADKAQAFNAQPVPPYSLGDIWTYNNAYYSCIHARLSGEAFNASDWVIVADKTSANTASDTSKVNGVAASTVTSNITNAQNTANSKAQTFISQPNPPYNVGDIWVNNGKTYVSNISRPSTASFLLADWVLQGDVTSQNTAADTAKVNGVDASTIVAQASNGDTANTNLNNLVIGGRNYLKNTSNMNDLTNWTFNLGSNIVGTLNIINDPVYNGVLDFNITTNNNVNNNWIVIENTGLTLPNGKFTVENYYTLSFLMKNDLTMYVEFADDTGLNPVADRSSTIPISTTWREVVYTFKATATGNTPVFYLSTDDQTSVGHVYVTNLQLEDGNKATGYNPAPEDVQNQIDATNEQMNTITTGQFMGNANYGGLTQGIINTVTSSSTYSMDMSDKAKKSDLTGLATSTEVQNAQGAAQTYADKKVAGIDFSPYVKNQTYVDDAAETQRTYTSSGGVNMLQNSVGFRGTDYWNTTLNANGTISSSSDPAMDQYGSFSGFAINGGMLQQTVTVTPNVPYTLGVIINKGISGDAYIKLDDGQGVHQTFDFPNGTAYPWPTATIKQKSDGTSYAYVSPFSINITPTSSNLTVTLYADAAVPATVFTCVMLNVGSQPFTWQQHMGEVYNANITFDDKGIRVSHTDDSGKLIGYTVMTPSLFAGYQDTNGDGTIDSGVGSVDEIFRMDQDTFVMKSSTIGPIKIVPVTTGGYSGVAFIKSS